jgi:acetyl-CoA C-acetyltransferase
MREVFIDNVSMTKFGRLDSSLRDLTTKAGEECIKNTDKKLDCLLIGAMNPEEFSSNSNISSLVADYLNIQGIPSLRIETASSSGAAIFSLGCSLISSGAYDNILLVAAEKMSGLDTQKVTKILAKVIEENERLSGASMPSLAAMVTMAYKLKYKIDKELLSEIMRTIAIKNHHNGSLNPLAHFQKEISEEDYNNSKIISNPLKMYDCSPISDGATALILTYKKTDVKVSGSGQATDTVSLKNRISLSNFAATRLAAKKAYTASSLTPKDINFAEVHDAFTSFEAINTEDLGFFNEGESYLHILRGETRITGSLPINPSGGLKSRGHPVGATGLAQIIDCVYQMRNLVSDSRQVPNNQIALCHSIGGMGNNIFVNILEKASNKRSRELFTSKINHELIPKINDSSEMINENEELEGRLASYTTLYVTPEGFDSPLTLGIIDTMKYKRIFARALFEGEFEIGGRITIFRENNIVYFRKTSYVDQIKFFARRNIKNILDFFE